MFVSQFLIILAHQDKALLNKYIQMDKECMELSSHLNTIFTYIRNQAVRAIQNNDVIALNTYATYLCRILQTPEGCTAFYESQHMLSSTDSKTVLIHYAQDYLAPFFGLHPADFFTVGRSMTPDISTIHAINATREQYINMMKGVETTCVSDLTVVDVDNSVFYFGSIAEKQRTQKANSKMDRSFAYWRKRTIEVQSTIPTLYSVYLIIG